MRFTRGNKTVGIVRDGVLFKENLSPTHLMYKFGGVPCIDKKMYDHVAPLKSIECTTTDNKKFTITGEEFDRHKVEFDYGFGAQYACDVEHWKIYES